MPKSALKSALKLYKSGPSASRFCTNYIPLLQDLIKIFSLCFLVLPRKLYHLALQIVRVPKLEVPEILGCRITYTKLHLKPTVKTQKVKNNWSTKPPNQSAECYKVNSTLKSHKVNKLIDKSAKSRAPNLKVFKPHQIVSKLRRI